MKNLDAEGVAEVLGANWLRTVSGDVIKKLAVLCNLVELQDKDVVYSAGGEQTWLWAVVSGHVRVHVALNEMEPTLGHIHNAGAWFGESEPLLGLPGLVDMRAAGATSVIRLPYARFRALANERPELWEALARLTAMHQVLAMYAANDLALPTGKKRLAAALLRLSGRRGVLQESRAADAVPATQQEIAGLANLAVSNVSAHLMSLADEKLIATGYGQIRLLDPDGLRRIIEA